jgi:hypothetical protein
MSALRMVSPEVLFAHHVRLEADVPGVGNRLSRTASSSQPWRTASRSARDRAAHAAQVFRLGAELEVSADELGPHAQRTVAHVVHGHIVLTQHEVLGEGQGVAVGAHHRAHSVAVAPEAAGLVIGDTTSPQPTFVFTGSVHHERG